MSAGSALRRPAPHEVTRLLDRWREGDDNALATLLPLVYKELRKIAAHHLRGERSDHTLQPTAVVNEAYLRLAGLDAPFQNRAHFFGAAARSMRQVLVDHARKHLAAKRPGSGLKVTLPDSPVPGSPRLVDVLALHEALDRLEQIAPRQARIVELRYFAGLSQEETATALDLSVVTVARDWRIARLMLRRWLEVAP